MLKGKFKALRDLAPSRSSLESAWKSSLSDEDKDDLRHFKENFARTLVAHKHSRTPKFVQERLASTMLLRRKHFLYLRWRHSGQQTKPPKTAPLASQKLAAPANPVAGPKTILIYTIVMTLRPAVASGSKIDVHGGFGPRPQRYYVWWRVQENDNIKSKGVLQRTHAIDIRERKA
jgi:hypothetical protein